MISNPTRRACTCLLLFLWAVSTVILMPDAPAAAEGEKVTAWSYYSYPPFVVEGNQGLASDFMAMLNKAANGRYVFDLEPMPRKRIDMLLEADTPGIVLFVSPEWMRVFRAKGEVWTPPIFQDRNGIISNISRKVDYSGPASVYGLTLGGVFGHKYKDLELPVIDGLISRHDAMNEELNVRKLADRRIDFMTAPESVLRYLVDHLDVQDRIYFSPTPLFEYTRHILMNNLSPDLRDFLVRFVEGLPDNSEWQEIRKRYKLH